MRAGARAPALHLPFLLSHIPLFSYRRALMFLFEKRAFLPACGPLPFDHRFHLDK
jgi:hypothetical protein